MNYFQYTELFSIPNTSGRSTEVLLYILSVIVRLASLSLMLLISITFSLVYKKSFTNFQGLKLLQKPGHFGSPDKWLLLTSLENIKGKNVKLTAFVSMSTIPGTVFTLHSTEGCYSHIVSACWPQTSDSVGS